MRIYALIFLFVGVIQCRNEVSLIVFSKNRPLQLYALLESIHDHVRGLAHVTVLYYAQDDEYEAEYQIVKEDFRCVTFVPQSRKNSRADFYDHLLKIIESTKTEYCMFAVDDIIVIRPIDLPMCVQALRTVPHAYGFYFRLGGDITCCYNNGGKTITQPPLVLIKEAVHAWDIDKNRGDWSWHHTVDMTIYRSAQVQVQLRTLREQGVISPNTFEDRWMCIGLPRGARGLCYDTSRIINIPDNTVQTDMQNRCMHSHTPGELLRLFQQGYRINTKALYDMPHTMVHVACPLPLRDE